MRCFLALVLALFFSLPANALVIESIQNLPGYRTRLKNLKRSLKKAEKFSKKQEKYKEKPQLSTNGKGIWVNIWNYPKDVEAFMNRLKRFDIDTIYLQINRSTTPIFKHPEKLEAIIEAAHVKNIRVIGWTYCYLNNNIALDARKYIEPALLVTKNGHRLDGMAADIEENISEAAVKRYTELIKAKIPEDYPMLAIVFSPRIKQKYPWKYIGANWDVLMPMTYWHSLKGRTDDTIAKFVRETVENLRAYTGKPDLNIHLITDGERVTSREVQVSLDTARKHNVNAGVSVYPEHLVTDEILEMLKDF